MVLLILKISGLVHSFLVSDPTRTKGLNAAVARIQRLDNTILRESTLDDKKLDPERDLGDILKPTAVQRKKKNNSDNDDDSSFPEDQLSDLSTTPYLEEYDPDADSLGDMPIPTTGISVAEEMEKAAKTRFYSEVVRITGLGKGVQAAQILSSTAEGAYEPVRYLIRLSRKEGEEIIDEMEDGSDADEIRNQDAAAFETSTATVSAPEVDDYVMVDVPPYSEKLVQQMKQMMGANGRLTNILVTCSENIHYNNAPGVFTIRRADLMKWEKAFPDVAIVAYRIDIPRDCRESVTQRLDGYGPWALQDASVGAAKNETFIETGIPMTYNEWDPDIAMDILEGRRKPPGEEEEEEEEGGTKDGDVIDLNASGEFIPEMIRSNEEGKRVLAVYTPGRTYGSISYVFPELCLCASGYTLPLEDTRTESWGVGSTAGPALDRRGFVTTSKAGISKQMESGRKLANDYSDRFQIVLPSGSDPFYLEENVADRRQTLLEIMDQYEKLGRIYEQLGITGSSEFD
jgi:glyoxylase-like metal-dependent hydrolase (beta-lactamase superfamily II)